ncbi:Uncharacterised conserved protein UCP028846 [Phaffia rhodozyma]|uniref:Uncharacterized conserved protein UCP028846 n=1 Tax=Phaffia rhodozyma TaxID=264483 RepID=A0A0F7SVH0_PHARH|nr:Uncharacterised conserved protein UCP028846 [Phaffia rhodozyma]
MPPLSLTLLLGTAAIQSFVAHALPPKFFVFSERQTIATVNESCPIYSEYSTVPHEPASGGPLGLPTMRPDEGCRTFTSTAVEDLLNDYTPRMKDRDLAMLFTNALPNTLDTTVRWQSDEDQEPSSFIVTGDIEAMWIRDSCNQLATYQPLAVNDSALRRLIKGAIAIQADYLGEYPYCGAFQPPAASGLAPTFNEWAYGVEYPFTVDNQTVFECKYELDSIAGFMKLSRQYYEYQNDSSYLTSTWFNTLDTIFELLDNQTVSTVDENGEVHATYSFDSDKIPVVNGGVGHPVKETGMIRTSFRPSDDLVIYGFHIPDNALLTVELRGVAKILKTEGLRDDLVTKATEIADRVERAIWDHGVFDHPEFGYVFAYEIDGFGGRVFMDDANVPSLMSLPYLGFLDAENGVYKNTRKMLTSTQGNPYFVRGKEFYGIGGPHVDVTKPWPMNLVSVMVTSDDKEEIKNTLAWLTNSTGGLGLIHESVNIHNSSDYTRQWFAWANSYFAEAVIKIAGEYPDLLF